MKGILGFTEDLVVSQDFVVIQERLLLTLMDIEFSFQKIISWYDNEYGFSSKLIDLSVYAGLK
jgi:glyceraldehyde 3-phosphate dehydrogenase